MGLYIYLSKYIDIVLQGACLLLDTSAWMEYFNRTENFYKVEQILKSGDCETSMASLAELYQTALKSGYEPNELISTVEQESKILKVTREVSLLAGRLNFERKKINKDWGMMDSFVLATAIINNLKILAKDSDFADLENVEML